MPVNGHPRIADGAATSAPPPIRKFTLDELREAYPERNEPLVDGLFRRGDVANIISSAKIGKSWLAYGLAACSIMGWSWLDRFPCNAGRVLLIDNELREPEIPYRIDMVSEAMQIQPGDLDADLEVWPLRGDLRSIRELGYEFETMSDHFDMVIIDAWYRALPPGVSENDNSEMAAMFNLVNRYAEQTGAAFVLIHHSSKGSQSDKRTTDVGSGAGSQSRAADAHLILREHENENTVVLDAALRSFPPIQPLVLKWTFPIWTPDALADPSQLKGLKTKQQENQAAADAEADKAIVSALLGDRLTSRKLREATGMSRGRIDRRLDALVAAGHVTYEIITVSNNECRQYYLQDDPTEGGGRV